MGVSNMEEWKEYRLGDIADIKGGKRLPKGVGLVTKPNNHPYIRIRDLGNNKVLELNDCFEYVDDETQRQISRYITNKDDIILSIVGTVGLVAKVGSSLDFANLTENCVKINNLQGLYNDYLYYYLISSEGQNKIKLGVVGAVQPKLPIKNIADFVIPVPSMEQQKNIASILSSLDDKIECNRKICANLEAQAQALFKHWFVDFAPFKDGKFVESEMGMIPLLEICEQITDGVHNSVKDEPDSDYMLLSCKNIVGGVLSKNSYRSISKSTFESLRTRTRLAKGDVLLSSVGTIGEIAIVEDEPLNYEFQRSVAIVKPKKKVGTYFLYNALLASKTRLQHAAHGAVQQCLFIGDLKKFEVYYYGDEKAFLYNETVKPLFEEVAKLHKESSRLSALRDALLPKLMSGEIKV